jgi:hypothetical protein
MGTLKLITNDNPQLWQLPDAETLVKEAVNNFIISIPNQKGY